MKRFAVFFLGFACLTIFTSLFAHPIYSQDSTPAKTIQAKKLFLDKIQPLLKNKCLGCHGDDPKLRAGLDLRTRAAMLKGGDSGPALVPGQANKSLLFQTVLRRGEIKMPPKEKDRLTKEEIAALRDWINAGAPWATATEVAKKGGKWKYDPEAMWAFKPVKHYEPPADVDKGWIKTPIDAFIAKKLAEKGLKPAPPAERITLIRRATYNLTGLPPTPEEIDAFVKDKSPHAFDKVIERLLASPRYGEQWGRHWLDVVRYADTSGYSNDFERPNAWRYRDYVIRSFNQDKPYDQFIREQLAGDELDPNNPTYQIAVGYLRMGPWEQTGMSVKAITRQLFLDDVTNSVGITFMALPLRCCRCHDHKFDPLPTRDYYRVQAVFAPVQFVERTTPFLKCENTTGFVAAEKRIQKRMKKNEARLKNADNQRKDAQEELRRTYNKRRLYYKLAAKRYEPISFSVASGGLKKKVKTQEVFILKGGSLQAKGERVTAGVLSAVHGSNDAVSPSAWNTIPQTTRGRRLAFARWIASAKHPLTARVMVNRIWQGHFGTGIVATSNNFGKMGKRPTHPELLDWLAEYFVHHGWRIKEMHRLIMRSAVYQMSGEHPDIEKVRKADPPNKLLAYFPPHRLTAEQLRDAILAVSGELSFTSGGPPVFPEINWDVALQPRQIMGALAPIYEPSAKREQRHRRTIYTAQIRGLGNPFLEVFNAPNPDTACERREESTVTPQVFTLFNSEFVHDMALAMAHNLSKQSRDPGEQIDLAFRKAFGRHATARESKLCLAHYGKMLDHHRHVKPAKRDLPRKIIRDRIAEFSGAKVQIVEDWNAEEYERNLQPWQTTAEVRALAEVCLVLLNSNEFLYVH